MIQSRVRHWHIKNEVKIIINFCDVQGSGHELYGYPGYGTLLLGSSGLEQNMPPSAGPPPSAAGAMAAAAGLMFSGPPYHPGYTTHSIQVQ